jgi:hypothetical protein
VDRERIGLAKSVCVCSRHSADYVFQNPPLWNGRIGEMRPLILFSGAFFEAF